MILSAISTYLGHLHPLVVHLPIGFLLLAVFFQLISYWPRWSFLKNAVSITLLVGFLSSVVACIFGFLLAGSGDYDYYQLIHHRNSGILLAILSGLLYLLTLSSVTTRFQIPTKLFSFLLIVMAGIMSYSGHQGAGLTHGADYLNLQILTKKERVPPTNVDEAYIYEDVVQPILESKCGSCHQGGKRKGGLSMLELKYLLKGGKTGPAVVPGHLNESELILRISLNPSDEKFMPTDGKPPLTNEEATIIRWWIEKGMAVEGQKMRELKETQSIKPLISYNLKLGELQTESDAAGDSTTVNPAIPASVDTIAIESLRAKGVVVRVMLQHPAMLDLTFPAGKGITLTTVNEDLRKIAKNTIWLNLSGNALTEKDLAVLSSFSNLEKIRLDKNPVSDGIVDVVANLKNLQSINLSETKLSKNGLTKLISSSSAKRIYCWGTAAAEMTGDSSGVYVRRMP